MLAAWLPAPQQGRFPAILWIIRVLILIYSAGLRRTTAEVEQRAASPMIELPHQLDKTDGLESAASGNAMRLPGSAAPRWCHCLQLPCMFTASERAGARAARVAQRIQWPP